MINWLASYPKSGNTWIRIYLEAYMAGNVDLQALRVVQGDQFGTNYELASPVDLSILSMYEWNMVRQAALLGKLAGAHYNPFILKTHSANVSTLDLPLIPKGITGASVYLIRDPRDIVPSFSRHMGNKTYDETIERMADDRNLIVQTKETDGYVGKTILASWKTHVDSWEKYGKNCLFIRYEDLKRHPHLWFEKIIKHYGIEWDQKKHDFAMEQSSFKLLQQREAKEGFGEKSQYTDRFFHDGSIGSHKDKLSEAQHNRIINLFGDVMLRYEYIETVKR